MFKLWCERGISKENKEEHTNYMEGSFLAYKLQHYR